MSFFDTKRCLYPKCSSESIKSHAISKRYSLDTISDANHLYHFAPKQFSQDMRRPNFNRIGTLSATSHNCFCNLHDGIFKPLDTREISTSNDVILQAYRSLCVLMNQEKSAVIKIYKLKSKDAFKKIPKKDAEFFLKINGHAELIPKLDDVQVLDIVRRKIHTTITEVLEDELLEVKRLSDYLFRIWEFNEDSFIPIGELQTLTTDNMKHTVYYYKTNFQIPVSVSGVNYGRIDGKTIKTYSIVVPYDKSSVVIGIIPNELLINEEVAVKINDFFSSDFRVVQYVESVMSTCDSWYLKPSVLDNMSEAKRNLFCLDCMFVNERELFAEYDFSIFDELKFSIVSDNEKVMLEGELSRIPLREEYDIRYERMIASILR